jgi:hypothetical protein
MTDGCSDMNMGENRMKDKHPRSADAQLTQPTDITWSPSPHTPGSPQSPNRRREREEREQIQSNLSTPPFY